MNKMLTNAAPLVATTACVLWCCWSQLREATPLLADTEASLPRIERKLLYPEISQVSARDPFLQYKAAPPPTEQTAAAAAAVPAKPPFNPDTAIAAIRLDATIGGATPLAVINGKVHDEGSPILLEKLQDVQCRLLRVFRNEIEVRIEQQTYRISYSHQATKTAAPAPAVDSQPEPPGELGAGLPEGIPLPGEALDRAVSDALNRQPQTANDDPGATAAEAGGTGTADQEEEACDYEQDLLTTETISELLNHEE